MGAQFPIYQPQGRRWLAGAVKDRGGIDFYSKSRKLLPLNEMATVMEYDIAADGTTVTEPDRP